MTKKEIIKTYCLKNQLRELIEYLKTNDNEKEYYPIFKERFIDNHNVIYQIDDKRLIAILHAYESYFKSVFYKKTNKTLSRFYLFINLVIASKRFRFGISKVEKSIQKLFNEGGYNFLGGTTSYYFGPYIWKTSDTKEYEVEIPESKVKVSITFMKDFLMNSWLEYISCGVSGTGGWSNNQGLFCNYSRYKDMLNKPEFTVSFLKHEAQHNYDQKNTEYKISPTVLEYRAKLCELVYYPDFSLLHDFLLHAKDDPNLTHSQAEFWVITDLSKRIFNKEYVEDEELWKANILAVREESQKLLISYNRCVK